MVILKNPRKKIIDSINYQHNFFDYKVQPGDILNIVISSIGSSEFEIFNKEYESLGNIQMGESSIFLNGYLVNSDGEIYLPITGTIKVSDLTIEEINSKVEEILSDYIKHFTVNIKLSIFKVTIIGEVRNPGTFNVYNTQINIIQALGMAGDITDLGNRKAIKIIRKTPTGSLTFLIDSSTDQIIGSKEFYLHPNDIIYVEPLKAKVLRVNSPAIQITLSVLTLGLIILNLTR